MNNPIGWFEIYVDNLERAIAFYQTVLNVTLENLKSPGGADAELWTFPSDEKSYGATGALIKMDGISAGSNSTMVYFSCEDCAIEESRVEAAGGEIRRSKFPIGEYGFCSLVIDSEGNAIGLHSMK